jgi:hypothetical protein
MGLNSTPTRSVAQVSAGTAALGDPIYIDASGYLAASATTSASSSAVVVNASASAQIAGFLGEAMAASSTSDVTYTPALAGVIFQANLSDEAGSPSSNAAIAQTDLGANMAIGKVSGDSVYSLIKSDSTASVQSAIVVGFIDAVGTAAGRVEFVVREAWRQHNG